MQIDFVHSSLVDFFAAQHLHDAAAGGGERVLPESGCSLFQWKRVLTLFLEMAGDQGASSLLSVFALTLGDLANDRIRGLYDSGLVKTVHPLLETLVYKLIERWTTDEVADAVFELCIDPKVHFHSKERLLYVLEWRYRLEPNGFLPVLRRLLAQEDLHHWVLNAIGSLLAVDMPKFSKNARMEAIRLVFTSLNRTFLAVRYLRETESSTAIAERDSEDEVRSLVQATDQFVVGQLALSRALPDLLSDDDVDALCQVVDNAIAHCRFAQQAQYLFHSLYYLVRRLQRTARQKALPECAEKLGAVLLEDYDSWAQHLEKAPIVIARFDSTTWTAADLHKRELELFEKIRRWKISTGSAHAANDVDELLQLTPFTARYTWTPPAKKTDT